MKLFRSQDIWSKSDNDWLTMDKREWKDTVMQDARRTMHVTERGAEECGRRGRANSPTLVAKTTLG